MGKHSGPEREESHAKGEWQLGPGADAYSHLMRPESGPPVPPSPDNVDTAPVHGLQPDQLVDETGTERNVDSNAHEFEVIKGSKGSIHEFEQVHHPHLTPEEIASNDMLTASKLGMPIGRHAAERAHQVEDSSGFYGDLLSHMDRVINLDGEYFSSVRQLKSLINDHGRLAEPSLTDHADTDPAGEQRVRAAVADALNKTANFLSPQAWVNEPANAELFEGADSELTPAIMRELEAILQIGKHGEQGEGQYRTQDGRIVDTYAAGTAFPDVELLYQHIRPDEGSKEAGRLRISLHRTQAATGESDPPAPVSLDEARAKRRGRFPRWRRGDKSEDKAA